MSEGEKVLQRYTLKNLLYMLREREISSQEIIKMYIQRISEQDTLINSFITLDEDAATYGYEYTLDTFDEFVSRLDGSYNSNPLGI